MAAKEEVPLPVDPKVAGKFPMLVDLPPDILYRHQATPDR
jgi:hypothetical protein